MASRVLGQRGVPALPSRVSPPDTPKTVVTIELLPHSPTSTVSPFLRGIRFVLAHLP